MKRGGLVVIAMVLVTGVFRWASPTTLSGSQGKSARNVNAEIKIGVPSARVPAAGIKDAIHEFYGSPGMLGNPLSAPEEVGGDDDLKTDLPIPEQDKKDIRFVITFVPDPVH